MYKTLCFAMISEKMLSNLLAKLSTTSLAIERHFVSGLIMNCCCFFSSKNSLSFYLICFKQMIVVNSTYFFAFRYFVFLNMELYIESYHFSAVTFILYVNTILHRNFNLFGRNVYFIFYLELQTARARELYCLGEYIILFRNANKCQTNLFRF